ncbi:MAG TPA: shikimate dehydrogenase [Clostridia bacterium]|nr:shikimate dehydrogenase [Clostridia bacterium]
MTAPEFRLIGHPVGHSISSQIHQRLFQLSHTNGNYQLMDVCPDELEATVEKLRNLSGFNVTIPFKQKIIPFLDEMDKRAARYGAVNTIKCENGRLTGYNTDADGFLHALTSAGIRLKGNVLICGAGGAARMMACEALERECSLTVATRTIGSAQIFADDLKKSYPDADLSACALVYASGSFDLILNATPCGMYPDVEGCPIPRQVARSAKAVFDAVYNPNPTMLLKKSAAAGAKTQGGLTMLVWQAAAAHEIWYDAKFRDDDILRICIEMEQILKNEFAQ